MVGWKTKIPEGGGVSFGMRNGWNGVLMVLDLPLALVGTSTWDSVINILAVDGWMKCVSWSWDEGVHEVVWSWSWSWGWWDAPHWGFGHWRGHHLMSGKDCTG